MVSPEQEKNSSSPNVKISGLTREGTDGSVLCVSLDDGSRFLLDCNHLPTHRLSVGLLLDAGFIADLESASEHYICRCKALSLLARSEQCRRGLAAKLFKKGYSQGAVSTSLDKLSSAGLLDDRRFAEAWVRSRLQHQPEGPSRLRKSLTTKGVSASIAREAVESVLRELGDDDADGILKRAMKKLSRRSGITEDKLINTLVRKGFHLNKILTFLREKRKDSSFVDD